jgi:hypothetical protein
MEANKSTSSSQVGTPEDENCTSQVETPQDENHTEAGLVEDKNCVLL